MHDSHASIVNCTMSCWKIKLLPDEGPQSWGMPTATSARNQPPYCLGYIGSPKARLWGPIHSRALIELVFLFLKPFSRTCNLMVIALQSAVRALICIKDCHVSWRTANWIVLLSAGVIFLGLPLDFFVPQCLGSLKKFRMTVLLYPTSAAMVRRKRPCLCSSTIQPPLKRESFLAS